jgi:hypothetical protein
MEAKTAHVADKLADWNGPVVEFTRDADIIVLTALDDAEALRFRVLSGASPLVEVFDGPEVRLRFSRAWSAQLPAQRWGGLAISMPFARRVRLNGTMASEGDASELVLSEQFTLCRKYIAPSVALEEAPHLGPEAREPVELNDQWVDDVLARAECAFLASISPDGGPDVAHRGGPPGFLEFDSGTGVIGWSEFVGDGVFKSAGNIRSTGMFTLLVPDFESGNGVELAGTASYTNTRPERRMRTDALVQHKDPFPQQGRIEGTVSSAFRLTGLVHRRQRIEKALRVTSCSTIDDQAPQ